MKELLFCFADKNLDVKTQEILIPKRGSKLASGFDLVSAMLEPIVIKPGARALINTGICIGVEAGFEGQIRGRSGLALKHGLMVLNSPGTIDADYRGEIKVILANLSLENFTVEFGMRIAQLIIAPVNLVELKYQESLDNSARGEGGFGSTGLHAQGAL